MGANLCYLHIFYFLRQVLNIPGQIPSKSWGIRIFTGAVDAPSNNLRGLDNWTVKKYCHVVPMCSIEGSERSEECFDFILLSQDIPQMPRQQESAKNKNINIALPNLADC